MDCANEDAYRAVTAVRQEHSGYRNPDNRMHGNGPGYRTFYRSRNPDGRSDQRYGHNQTRPHSHTHGNNRYQNLQKNPAADSRIVEPQRITGQVSGIAGLDKVPPAVTDKREAQNARGEMTAEDGVCPKETADAVSASAVVTTTVDTFSSSSTVPNVWKHRQEFCRGAQPSTAEEEEEMLRKALELSKLEELERRSEIDEEELRSLPSLTIDNSEEEQATSTSPTDDDPAIFRVISSSTYALSALPSSDAEAVALPSAVGIHQPGQIVPVSRAVKEDWDAECIEIEVRPPQSMIDYQYPTNTDDQNQDSTLIKGGCDSSAVLFEPTNSEQATFFASSHVSASSTDLHSSRGLGNVCTSPDHISPTVSLPSAAEWNFSASAPPISCSSTVSIGSLGPDLPHAVTDCDVDGTPSILEPNFTVTAGQNSDLPFTDSNEVDTRYFSPSLHHTSEPIYQNPEPLFNDSNMTIDPSYFPCSEHSTFNRKFPPGFNACSPSGISIPYEPEESGFTFTFTDNEQLGLQNHPQPERNFSVSSNEHESPCNFSESDRSANSSVSLPFGESGSLQDTTAVDNMNCVSDQQQPAVPASNGICTECHCEKNANPPAYSSNPLSTIYGQGFPPGHVPFICPPMWSGHPQLMPTLAPCSMPYLPYPPQLGYPIYPGTLGGGLPYMASPYGVLPTGLPGLGLGAMPGVLPGYVPFQQPMMHVSSPFAVPQQLLTAPQPACSCGSDRSCVEMHSTKPCD